MPDETEARVRWTRAERDTVMQLREAKGFGPTRLSQLTGVPVPQIKFWLSSSKWATKKADASASYKLQFQDWESWVSKNLRAQWLRVSVELGIDRAMVPLRPAIEEWLRGLPTTCSYCLTALTPKNFAVDHKIPTARGGALSFDNLTQCCRRCNLAKGSLTADEFIMLRNLVAAWEDQGKSLLARLAHGFIGGRRFGGKK